MTGNDIVDLQKAQVPEGEKIIRFRNKVFSDREQEILELESGVGVWSLWAMKESVYKAHHRQFNLSRTFDPKRIQIHEPALSGNSIHFKAEYMGIDYSGSGSFSTEYVHCTATSVPSIKMYEEIYADSGDIKTRLKATVSAKLDLKLEDLNIEKNENFIPQFKYKKSLLKLPFSLSHHGKFAAFSFQLMNY